MSATLKNIRFTYNFATQGGAEGTLLFPVFVPANAVMTRLLIIPYAIPTSADSTADIQIMAGSDVIGTDFGPGGNYSPSDNLVYDLLIASDVLIQTIPNQISMVISVEALTGGHCDFILEYYQL